MFCVAMEKDELLSQAKQARFERELDKKKERSAIAIQAVAKGYLVRKRLKSSIVEEINGNLCLSEENSSTIGAVEVYKIVRKYLAVFHGEHDAMLEIIIRYILSSMESNQPRCWYVSVALSRQHALDWIRHIKRLLMECSAWLRKLNPASPSDSRHMTLCLHMLITFTDTASWKLVQSKGVTDQLKTNLIQICHNILGHLHTNGLYLVLQEVLLKGLARSSPQLKRSSLSSLLTLSLRPLIAADFSPTLLANYVVHILSIPSLLHHSAAISPECMELCKRHSLLAHCLQLLSVEQSLKIAFNSLEGTYALCLLANLIQLGQSDQTGLTNNLSLFIGVIAALLEKCKSYVSSKRSNLTSWHPVLGWFNQPTDSRIYEAMPVVGRQLRLLWQTDMVSLLLDASMGQTETPPVVVTANHKRGNADSGKKPFGFMKGTSLLRKGNKVSAKDIICFISTPQVELVCRVASLYGSCLSTLSQLRLDILSGLAFHPDLLLRVWHFLCVLSGGNFRLLGDVVLSEPDIRLRVEPLLVLFADAAAHLVGVLDETEIYVDEKPFRLDDLNSMGLLLNWTLFHLVWNHLELVDSHPTLFSSLHSLLVLLYDKDSRRTFLADGSWVVKELRAPAFLAEQERGSRRSHLLLHSIPHVLEHRDRVTLFRKLVARERESLTTGGRGGRNSAVLRTVVTIRRDRVVEDGYEQLARLEPRSVKGVIRVKFVNAQGLDEPGIDQDGVFKEFLEETIQRVFDPGLNLFKLTSSNQLYPSTSSSIQESHLQLFEFVGKMLAKSLYEGLLVEVPLATFFLSNILGKQRATYSSMDDLPSLDQDLYKNLTFLKHYEGCLQFFDPLKFSHQLLRLRCKT